MVQLHHLLLDLREGLQQLRKALLESGLVESAVHRVEHVPESLFRVEHEEFVFR